MEELKAIMEKFEFRNIKQEETEQAIVIEQVCFPPNEACSEQNMKDRISMVPELFLVAVDKKTGQIAGFLNGLATDEPAFRDAFFTDASLHHSDGKNIMLLGLEVLLTCLDEKVKMYEKFGFVDQGIANSAWGGEEWHEMSCTLVSG